MLVTGFLVVPDVVTMANLGLGTASAGTGTSSTATTSTAPPTTSTTITTPCTPGDPGCTTTTTTTITGDTTTRTTNTDGRTETTSTSDIYLPGGTDIGDPIFLDGEVFDSTSPEAVEQELIKNAAGICSNLLSCYAQVLRQTCDNCENKWKNPEDMPLIIYNVRTLVKPTRNNNQYTATITYETNKDATTKMYYDVASAVPKMLKQQNNLNSNLDKDHTIVIIVKPDTNYFFQVVSKAGDEEVKSEVFSFLTPEYKPDLGNLIMRIIKQKKS